MRHCKKFTQLQRRPILYGKGKMTQDGNRNSKGRAKDWGKQSSGSRSEPYLRRWQQIPRWVSELLWTNVCCVHIIFLSFWNGLVYSSNSILLHHSIKSVDGQITCLVRLWIFRLRKYYPRSCT